MLNLIFQRNKAKDPSTVIADCRGFFDLNKKASWFQDPFVQKILELIDCEYIIQSHKAIAINKKQIFKLEKVDVKLSIIRFENYSKTALLGYKFKNNIILDFKKSGNYHVE